MAKLIKADDKKNQKSISETGAGVFDAIIFICIFLIFLLCPLFFTGLVAQGFGFEKMIVFYFLVFIGIVSWTAKGIAAGKLAIKRTPLDWPILGIILVYAIATALSINIRDSLLGSYGSPTKSFLAIFLFVLFYYLLVNNINKNKIKIFFWTLVFSGSLIIIFSSLQLILAQAPWFDIFSLAFLNINNFNPVGSLTGLSMVVIIFFPILITAIAQLNYINPNINKIFSLIIKIFLSLILFLGLIVLVVLDSYTFWLAAIISLVVVLIFLLSKIIETLRNNLIIPLIMFLSIIVLFGMGDFNLNNQLVPEIALSRQASWNIAKSSLMNDPILGSGPSTFYYAFSKYKDLSFNYTDYWNVRFDASTGIIFELLATIGVAGTVLFISLLLIALSLMFLNLIKGQKNENSSILLALFSSCIAIIIFNFLFNVNNSVFIISYLIFVLTTAISVFIYPEAFKTFDLSFRASPKYALALSSIFLIALTFAAVLFLMGIKIYYADYFARKAIVSTEVERRIDYLNKAISLNPYQDKYYKNISNNYIIMANNYLNSGNTVDVQNYLSLAIDNGKKAVELSPRKAENIESLALVYENASFYTKGALEWSVKLYNNLTELEPSSPFPYLRLALIEMANANSEKDKEEIKYHIEEAIKNYEKSIERKSNLSSAYYGKAVAYERLEDIDKAIEQLKQAVLIDKNNIDYLFELGRLYFNKGFKVSQISQTEAEEYVAGEAGEDDLSVESDLSGSENINSNLTNENIALAEQIFVHILKLNPNHANSLYSLALLYKKTNNNEAQKIAMKLIEILQSEEEKNIIRSQFGI